MSSLFFYRIISLPKGVSAKEASLKCCLAKGMPIIVMANKTPNTMCDKLIHMPPIKNHNIFINVDKHPGFPGVILI